MNFFKKIWEAIRFPFEAMSVLIEGSREENLDGSYDKYWAKRNEKMMKKGNKK